MELDLNTLIKERFGSNDKAGVFIRDQWQQSEPKVKIPTARSLGVKIGELTKGQLRWWRNHRTATKILCEELGIDDSDIIGFQQPDEATELGFPEFPALRPLSKKEPPCDIFRFTYTKRSTPMFRTVEQIPHPNSWKGAPNWLVIPPGGGKRILSWVLRAHFETSRPSILPGFAPPVLVRRVTLKSASEISQIPMEKKDEVLIVVIGGFSSSESDDWTAIEQLRERGNVVVLAPFEPGDGWEVSFWCPEDGWRNKLISWVYERITTCTCETLLEPDLLANLLDQNDHNKMIFSTPSDVLSLCSYAHKTGRIELKKRFNAADWAEAADTMCTAMIHGACVDQNDVDTRWLRALGAQAMRELAQARFANLDVPLSGGLKPSTWAALLPERLAPGRPTSESLRKNLNELAREPDEKTRIAKANSLHSTAFGPAKAEAVGLLGQAGLLQRTASEGVDITPGWFCRVWQEELVRSSFEGDHEIWGRWTIDPKRLDVVRAELAALDAVRYGELVKRLASAPRKSPALFSACEALFREAVRRLEEDKTWKPSDDLLHHIWQLQSQSLVPRGGLMTPLFRQSEAGDWAEWIADCWTFSLHAPAPDEVPAGMQWLFPGWTNPPLDDVPQWLEELLPMWNSQCPEHAATRIDQLAPAVLGKAQPLVNKQCVPEALLLGAFRPKQFIHWPLPFCLIKQLLKNHSAAAYLGEYVSETSEIERREIVDRFWLAIREGPKQEPQDPYESVCAMQARFEAVPYLSQVRSADKQLHAVIVNTLSEEQIEAAFDGFTPEKAKLIAETEGLLNANQHLPPRLRLAMIRKLLTLGLKPQVEAAILKAASESLGETPEDANLAELLAITPDPTGGLTSRRNAMATLWHLAPDRALNHARAAWPNLNEARDWFTLAPFEWSDRLLDDVESTTSSKRPAWVLEWLVSRFPPALRDIDRVFQLISEVQEWA